MKQETEDEEELGEEEASSRSIAKHWVELVYRRVEGERGGGGGGGRVEDGTRRS